MSNDKNKPLHTFNLGSVHAAIFPQQGEKGSFLSVTLHRNYKDGEEWKQSNTYTATQLANLIAVAQASLDYMVEAKKSSPQQAETPQAKVRSRA